MNSSTSLEGKVALIVGASSGLGKELVRLLAEENAKVFAMARGIAETDLPGSVIRIPLNIRKLDSLDEAFAALDAQTDHIDILVNCAGIGLVKKLEDTSREEVMDIFGTNLKGSVYTSMEAYKRMIPRKSGHIVNVISTSGATARADETLYCASKFGLRGFTESLRLEAAPHHIRVTGILPGGMQTAFWEEGKDVSKFMKPEDVAAEIINVLKSPPSISMSEVRIDRGV